MHFTLSAINVDNDMILDFGQEKEVQQGLHTGQHLNVSDLNFPDPKLTL